ncbi:MAG: DNA alkylation repair protein [Blautia sp.]
MEEKQEIVSWIRMELKKHTDEAYKAFHRSLVPGLENMMGVRIPDIRKIAKTAAKEDYYGFVAHADVRIYEEQMIRGMMIGYARLTIEEQKKELEKFVPFIDNWAVCDSCCTTYKFMKKNQEEWFAFLLPYLSSEKEYEIRFAAVCMLDFFMNDIFVDRLLDVFSSVHHEGYYAKMAIAWAVSVCYVKFPGKTEVFLLKNTLDPFTHNKAIQKIRESYRVSKEKKEHLNQLKRGTK